MRRCKLLLVALTAATTLGALAATASARSFSTSSQTFRAQFIELRFISIAGETRCRLTLEGSFHTRTIAKVRERLIGYITAANLGACTSGTNSILQESLPWHITYDSFFNTLPNIDSIINRVIGFTFRFNNNRGGDCLARSTAARPMGFRFNLTNPSHVVSTASFSGEIPMGPECFGANAIFAAESGFLTVLNSSTRITLTLI